jgi:hypothetical protein
MAKGLPSFHGAAAHPTAGFSAELAESLKAAERRLWWFMDGL